MQINGADRVILAKRFNLRPALPPLKGASVQKTYGEYDFSGTIMSNGMTSKDIVTSLYSQRQTW